MTAREVRIERVVYGGLGLTRIAETHQLKSAVAFVPYVLPGELVDAEETESKNELKPLRILKASPERVQPGCPHFGICGGCQLQMASYPEQLRLKTEVLRESLDRAGVLNVPPVTAHSAEPWHYRNRIRLHVTHTDGRLRLGYRERESKRVVPITTCPIAAQLLWNSAEALLSLAERDDDLHDWLGATAEVEVLCNEELSRLQISFLCTQSQFPASESFTRAMTALHRKVPQLAGAGALRVHSRTGRTVEALATWGVAGLNYAVGGERYWIARGGFFQVNRFLLPTMVGLVCERHSGSLAWDLFAGVGLFARVLAGNFNRVTAVEANPAAARELNSALQRLGTQHKGITAVIEDFVRSAAVQRERPDLIVLDPPRAGAGTAVCKHLLQVAPSHIVYVSCDPVTLARDLSVLQGGYEIEALHMLDLFPQTYHQEAVVQLRRRS